MESKENKTIKSVKRVKTINKLATTPFKAINRQKIREAV